MNALQGLLLLLAVYAFILLGFAMDEIFKSRDFNEDDFFMSFIISLLFGAVLLLVAVALK